MDVNVQILCNLIGADKKSSRRVEIYSVLSGVCEVGAVGGGRSHADPVRLKERGRKQNLHTYFLNDNFENTQQLFYSLLTWTLVTIPILSKNVDSFTEKNK